LQVNTQKAQASLKLSLQKAGIVTPPRLQMRFVLDVSGSFEDEHRDGTTNDLMARMVPWGMTFDPDQKLDVMTFSNGPTSVHEVGTVNADNYQNFVRNHIYGRVPGWRGGTDYSYALEEALRGYGWLDNEGRKAGFLGKLFGQKDEAPIPRERSLIAFVTDGENADPERTIRVLRESEQRHDGVYFLFIGISNQGNQFPFLESLGEQFSNTGYVRITDLARFVTKSDEELNDFFLSNELLRWMKQ
jgi:hypothetical protein